MRSAMRGWQRRSHARSRTTNIASKRNAMRRRKTPEWSARAGPYGSASPSTGARRRAHPRRRARRGRLRRATGQRRVHGEDQLIDLDFAVAVNVACRAGVGGGRPQRDVDADDQLVDAHLARVVAVAGAAADGLTLTP